MAQLFESTTLSGIEMANRFVRSATWEGLADQKGRVTQRLVEMMVELAREKVGLIISGYAFVNAAGQAGALQLGAHDDSCVPGLSAMAGAVHAAGGKIALQLAHGGCWASTEQTGMEAVGASALETKGRGQCRAASLEDIAEIVSGFVSAAVRGRRAGFDAVQVHAAHGYLLSQFLSPAFNKRTDQYGGSLMNRARILLEVVGGIRQEVGDDYPILVKLNSEDFLEGGMTREEAVEVAVMLERASVNALELSGGSLNSPKKLSPVRAVNPQGEAEEVYYRQAVPLFRERLTIPLVLVGGIRSLAVAERIVEEDMADYVSLSRPLIREPGLVSRWQKGDRRSAACISCNGCFIPGMKGKGISCTAV